MIGWDHEITAQIEGLADFPTGAELDRIRECYFVAYPDGRDRLRWPGIAMHSDAMAAIAAVASRGGLERGWSIPSSEGTSSL